MVLEQPPRIELGEFATPVAFDLAKKLRKAPRQIAGEIAERLPELAGFQRPEIAGAGYLNFKLEREAAARLLLAPEPEPEKNKSKVLVEHTSINPNKAAHIGHLRNAALGDTFVRLLRHVGHPVDVQNYIDNTGVQVADVVVGFAELEKKSLAEVEALIATLSKNEPGGKGGEPFDYYCWDLYAKVSQWYEQAPENKQKRLDALHAIEAGGNEMARIGEAVSAAVLRRHLETMERLDIRYDFLPRESEILHLHFWDLAFEQLKQRGVLYFETEGKNKGCWVMKRAGTAAAAEAASGPDEEAKVIVRSNGTVTYVGKDIAYHLWKFGLLGKDFGYARFYRYPDGKEVWISTVEGEREHPHFGDSQAIYNVIDARQMDPQNNVIEALRAMGYVEQAKRYTHFSYQMVALTPRCARELGYEVAEEDRGRAYIEVSGRKGFGVKADDLLDALIAAAAREVDARNPALGAEERQAIATDIAIGALRYFMLKFTKNSVIAFDFKDALAFEGETGPYLQYTATRLGKIFQKAEIDEEAVLDGSTDFAALADNKLWELWVQAGKLSLTVEQCVATTEPAYLAKYAFQLAQQANTFYHDHHILSETDAAKKQFLLATAAVARRALVESMELMGIPQPAVM